MKKFFVTSLIVVTVLTVSSLAQAEFSDVPVDHPNYEAINYVQAEGIVSGYPDGTFKPDITINRAEFTKILVEAQVESVVIEGCLGDLPAGYSYVYYPDVPKAVWYAKYICVATDKGYISGYPDGTFQPGGEINFAEAAKIIVKAFGYSVAPGDPWFKSYVEVLAAQNVIPVTVYDFGENITRGEMAEMIYRLRSSIDYLSSKTYDEIDTANWFTHVSQSAGYQIRYPRGYSLESTVAVGPDMDRLLETAIMLRGDVCHPEFEGYCFDRMITVKVYSNAGSQTLDQYLATAERYQNWDVRWSQTIDGMAGKVLYPAETELYAVKYVFPGGVLWANNIYQYFFDIEITAGIDEGMQSQVLETFRFRTETGAFIQITAPSPEVVLSEQPFYIYGETSSDCSRIVAYARNEAYDLSDTYELQTYHYGDTTFKYGVEHDWNNLEIGKNTYTFTAYCDGGTKNAMINIFYVDETAAEMGKPVIYLYPEQEQEVYVLPQPENGITVSEPLLGDGWRVTAKPDGEIVNGEDGSVWEYLFWEGYSDIKTPTEGFVVSSSELNRFFSEKLAYLGLNEKETADFKEFWLKMLGEDGYYFISFISQEELDEHAPLKIVPEPETVIRVYFDYKFLGGPIEVEEQVLKPGPERNKFTVVEWGGSLHH